MKSVTDQVYENIKNLIYLGKIQPGERIDYNLLQTEFNVSIIPIREATKLLVAEGLVELQPRKGTYVRNLKTEEIDEIYYLRGILETNALKEAIKSINNKDIIKLKEIANKIKIAKKDRDSSLLFSQNKDFHLFVYSLANKPFLLKLIQQLWAWTAPYRTIYHLASRDKREDVDIELHQTIIEACEKKDTELGIRAMLGHFERARKEIKSIAEKINQERGNYKNE